MIISCVDISQKTFAGILVITGIDAKKPFISVLICCLPLDGTDGC